TRSKRDWSSDVCSSDLKDRPAVEQRPVRAGDGRPVRGHVVGQVPSLIQYQIVSIGRHLRPAGGYQISPLHLIDWVDAIPPIHGRSEERRVGNESRGERE